MPPYPLQLHLHIIFSQATPLNITTATANNNSNDRLSTDPYCVYFDMWIINNNKCHHDNIGQNEYVNLNDRVIKICCFNRSQANTMGKYNVNLFYSLNRRMGRT